MTRDDLSIERYQFADLVLDLGQRRLWRDGELVPLPKLTFDVLRVLVEAAPNIVTHDQLVTSAWGPKRIVTTENLTQRVLMLRQSLSDSAAEPRYVESIRGHGYRLIPNVVKVSGHTAAAGEIEPKAVTEGRDRWSISMLGVAVIGVLVAFTLAGTGTYTPETRYLDAAMTTNAISIVYPEPLPQSIAVLPFEKLNVEPEPGYIAEAIHAELVNKLGRHTDLNVIARASVLHYSDTDLPLRAIAEELRVESVVKGTIHYSDDAHRVITELIEAETGRLIWTKSYDMQPDDLFTVGTLMTMDIGNMLDARTSPVESAAKTVPTTSSEAYAFYVRALDIFGQDTIGTRATAQTFLDQAIALDPDFAHAYAGKALIHAFSAINSGDAGSDGSLSINEYEARARDYIAKAIEIDPATDLAHYALGVMRMFSWQWDEAHASFTRAIDIAPQHATFLAQLAWLEVCGLGRSDGRQRAERAAQLDPRNPYVFERLSSTLSCAGDAQAALAATEQALMLDPTTFQNRMSRAFLTSQVHGDARGLQELRNLEPLLTEQRVLSIPAIALAYARLGHNGEAQRLIARFRQLAEARRTGPANWYLAYLALSDYDNAYEMLKESVDNRRLGPGFYTLAAFMNSASDQTPFNETRFIELKEQLKRGE